MGKATYLIHIDMRGRWAARRQGARRSSRTFHRRRDAVRWATPRATTVFIHARDGTVENVLYKAPGILLYETSGGKY